MRLQPVLFVCIISLSCLLQAQQPSSCVSCHGDSSLFEEERLAIVEAFQSGVHASVGLSCHDCHGGNPAPDTSEDLAAAMDPSFRSNPYIGSPERKDIPRFCGSCHSDPEYMKRFSPDVRVDQEREYWTSQHGKALKSGDTNVAVCIDCHGVHGIQPAEATTSPVFPKNVAQTCATCHADPDHMKGYKLPSGDPLPTDQMILWQASVHGRALLEREDLSAPTCNDCHGNHGAAPPGLDSISYVCGQCHGREAGLFRKSPKLVGFQTHNEFLADSESVDCQMCHELPAEFEQIGPVRSFAECETCHGNHGVLRPTVAMLGNLPETPCAFCHESPVDSGEGESFLTPDQEAYRALKQQVVSEGRAQGHEGTDLFNWLLDQALQLPTHTFPSAEEGESRLRPEFSRLFEKFRIGKTSYQITEAVGEGTIEHKVIQCTNCHAHNSESRAAQTAATYLDRTRRLTLLTAASERTLLRARRGGVETRDALTEIDAAIDSQIDLQVLVHDFSVDEGSDFSQAYASGLEHAQAAQEAAQLALKELGNRRRGLGVALIFIVLTLVGLGLKIRQVG